MERVKLTAENIRDAAEFVDRDGARCARASNGRWSWFGAPAHWTDESLAHDIRKDSDILVDAYVTRWLPGREPKAPAMEKWAVGYMTKGNEYPPAGTVLSDGTSLRAFDAGDECGPGWVVVKAAPQEPARTWRLVMLEVRGNGDSAEVRLSDGSVFDNDTPLSPSTIAAFSTPAPDVDRMRAALEDFAEHGTRHDLCPSLSWSSEQELAVAFTRYIKRMDDHVRERASAALGRK